jgi:N-acetylneuraminic acid mutarotase
MRMKSFIPVAAMLVASLVYSCQEEKFTEKGLPEVKTVGVTMLEDGATFHGMILTDGGTKITEHGFSWAPSGSNDPSDLQYFYLGPVSGETRFSVTVNSAIEKDEDYVMRAFVKTDAVTSYGNEVTFSGRGSKSPELVSVTPASAQIGDTVVISGHYFSNNLESCTVYFGNAEAQIISTAIDHLEVVVPYVIVPEVDIRVVITGIVSSENLSFNVLLPAITEITPASAPSGDTVVIRGNYFAGDLQGCSVFFGSNEARVLAIAGNEIRAIVPYTSQASAQVRVITGGIPSVNTRDFAFTKPVTLGIAPQSGTFGDVVNLYGNYLPLDTTWFGVYFNDVKARVTDVSRTRLQVKVPTGNNSSPVVISIRYFSNYVYTDRFTLNQAVVDDVTPVLLEQWGPVVITGGNFNPDPAMMRVEIGGREATIISASANEIRAQFPTGLFSGQYQVSVMTIAGSPVVWDGYIEYKSVWARMADFPPSGRMAGAGFVLGGKVYFGTGVEPYLQAMKDFWEYDPATNQWARKADHPVLITYASGLAADGMGYFAMGKLGSAVSVKLVRYDPVSNSWQYLAPRPGDGSTMDSPGFAINGKLYIPAAREMYEYNPATNIWTKKSYPSELGYFGGGAAFSINGKGYLGIGWVHDRGVDVNDFFEYDPATDKWTRKASFPGALRDNATSFSLPNGKGYVGMGLGKPQLQYLTDIWEYDPVADSWTRTEDFPGTPRCGARAFVVGSAAYIVAGYGEMYEKDMWRFSPGE